ncbi:GTPase activating protein [Irineochytrium annulatum]|nr:GTPase activating protein [Irineochytrium annulatum]
MDNLRDILITYACNYEGSDGLAFVQGMVDLASPVLIVMEGDESDAFWCFADLKEKMHDGLGMRTGLTTLSKLLQLTDRHLHAHLDLTVPAVGGWLEHFVWRDAVVRHLYTFDEVLKYVNDLSGTLPLDPTLEAAQLLYTRSREGVQEVVTEGVRRWRGREVIEEATRREEVEPGFGVVLNRVIKAKEEQRERLRKGKERERGGDKLKAR